MDRGVMGVQVPHVNTAEDARGALGAGVERHRERGGAVDDVRVREDLAVLVDDHAGAHDGLEPALRLGLVDLHRLDRDDGGRDALEHHGEGLGARLRAGRRREDERSEQREAEPHREGMIHQSV